MTKSEREISEDETEGDDFIESVLVTVDDHEDGFSETASNTSFSGQLRIEIY